MDWLLSAEHLARLQFGFIALFHILWPPLTIGLSIGLFLLEWAWLRTGREVYYHHLRFWTKLFLLNFGVGVISGVPMEFSFGTNWGPFSTDAGNFLGNILGFETVMAFMLEAGFLGIMLFGWKRVGPRMHLFATGMVALGTTLSAFWIMVANSWMQTPAGVVLQNGKILVTDWLAAVFNPDMPYGVGHMFIAAFELSAVVVAGVSAYKLLRRENVEFFRRSLVWAVVALVVIAPLQVIVGDSAGSALAQTQPAKLAAIEAHWKTNPPGEGAPWALLAIPDQAKQDNTWALTIPDGLSLIVTKTLTGKVVGLRDFPPQDQPPVWIPFYAFRIMVAAGLFVVALAFWTGWLLWRRRDRLSVANIVQQRWLLRGWVLAVPAIYLAVLMGWTTREVGRQPWLVYGLIRTSEGVSQHPAGVVAWSLAMYVIFYTVIGITALWLGRRMVNKGPTFEPPPPLPARGAPQPVAPMAMPAQGGH